MNRGCAAYFNGMKSRVSGRFRCHPAGWLAGLGWFNFRLAGHPFRTQSAPVDIPLDAALARFFVTIFTCLESARQVPGGLSQRRQSG